MVIKTITEEADVGLVSKSTEETVNKIEGYNDKRETENIENDEVVVGSMDIEKWYQRTIPKPSAKVVRKMVEESKVIFAGVKYDKVSTFLGEELTLDELKAEEFEEVAYIKQKLKRNLKRNLNPNLKMMNLVRMKLMTIQFQVSKMLGMLLQKKKIMTKHPKVSTVLTMWLKKIMNK